MKKKYIILLMIIGIVLCGCNKESKDITEINVNSVSNIIEKRLDGMKNVDKDELKDVYGLDTSNMDKVIIKENEKGDLYAIIKCKDKDKCKSSMNDYFKKVKEFNQSYSPERLKILENREEREIGDYLIYIVSKDAEDIYQNIVDSL